MSAIPPNKIIFVLAPPSSSKATIFSNLNQEPDYFHLSVGEHLRNLVQAEANETEKSPFVEYITPYLEDHQLIPTERILTMLHSKIIQERVNGKINFLIEGFPRNLQAAALWDGKMRVPDLVLVFECPREIALERFLEREGNTEEVFQKRYAEYERRRAVLFQRYDGLGIVMTVDSSGSAEQTRHTVLRVMKDD